MKTVGKLNWWRCAFALGAVAIASPAQTLTTLYTFSCTQGACPDGANPYSSLVEAINGEIYGTTPVGGAANAGTVFKITQGGAFTMLYNFCSEGGCADGSQP